MWRTTPLTLAFMLALTASGRLLPTGLQALGNGQSESQSLSNEIFPGAERDAAETAALAGGRAGVAVYRTSSPFDVVVNYYRYKRKQGVHISEEDLSLRVERIAAALDRGVSRAALETDPFTARFHAFAASRHMDLAEAWRDLGRRYAGRVQRVAEGQRVTIYRPWISQRSFTLIDETVILLRSSRQEEIP